MSQKYSHIRMSAYPTGTPPSPLGSEADLLDDGWPPLRFKDPSEPDIPWLSPVSPLQFPLSLAGLKLGNHAYETFGTFVKRVDSVSSC